MKTYTSRDIADAIISSKITRETTFVLESDALKQIRQFKDTLELLHSVQNGCPLPKYQEDWNTAMTEAASLLGGYRE